MARNERDLNFNEWNYRDNSQMQLAAIITNHRIYTHDVALALLAVAVAIRKIRLESSHNA